MYAFSTMTGVIRIDHDLCRGCAGKPCIAVCGPGILELNAGLPVLSIPVARAARGGCTECLACELACAFEGRSALIISLPIAGLPEVHR